MALDDSVLENGANITVHTELENTANDSDKTFTVPTDMSWEIICVEVELTTTGTAGNRDMELDIRDDSSVSRFRFRSPVVQAAGTTYRYHFYPMELVRETAVSTTANEVWVRIPKNLILHPGWELRIRDAAAIDAAADDMTVSYQVYERQ